MVIRNFYECQLCREKILC